MNRINEIVKDEEDKKKATLKIDKASSARIIKRSLWMNASKKKTATNETEDTETNPPKNKHVKFD